MVQRRLDYYLQRPEDAKLRTPGAASFLHLPYQCRYRIYVLAGLVRFCPINLNQEGVRARYYRDGNNPDIDHACFYESRRFLGNSYAIDCIAGCQCPPLPFNLFYASRDVSDEVLRILYQKNVFTISATDAWALRPLRNLSASALTSLRSLTVRLNNGQCIYGSEVLSKRRTAFPFCHPLCQTYQLHDQPLRRHARQHRAIMQQWQQIVVRLAAHCQVGSLRIDLICDSADIDTAKDLRELVSPLAEHLQDCSIRFGSNPSWEYFSLARTTAKGLLRRQSTTTGQVPKEQVKKTYYLPTEILTKIIGYSDLIAPYDLEWRPDKGLAPFDCCKKCTATLDCCTCPPRQHGAYSTTCTCWKIPLSLFLVGRQVCAIAKTVFFQENRFIILPSGSRLDSLENESAWRPMSQALHNFFERLPVGASRLLRSVGVYVPTQPGDGLVTTPGKLIRALALTLGVISSKCDVAKLSLAIFVALNHELLPNGEVPLITATEDPWMSSLADFQGFRDLFIYLQWPRCQPGVPASRYASQLESVVMGAQYDAKDRGKWVDLPRLWYDGESREGPVFAADGSQFTALLTLSLGSLIVWGNPIIPDDNNGVSTGNEARGLEERIPPVKVNKWTGLGDGTDTKPTFYADLGVIFHKPNNTEVDEHASDGGALHQGKGPLTVLDARRAGHRPHQERREDGDAPAWWSQVKDRKPSVHLHAEDCAAFRYENSLKMKLKAGDKYPEGSYISVYGRVNRQGAKKVPLCSGGGNRPLDPPCSKVFDNLGVKH
ncbi:hypothetical protein PG995_007430 [Apiospora arundinis]